MGRMNLKPTAKPSKPAKAPAMPKNKSKNQLADGSDAGMDGAKLVTGVGIAGIVGSLLCLVVFFQSDIPTKIVAANVAHASQMNAQADNKPELAAEGGEETASDVSDSSTGAAPAIVIAPGAVISREDLAGYLQEMTTEDFTELAESVDMVIASDPASVNLPERKSLAEAYAEAESKYPGQIDGTQRLKLVDELNAIDYTYYVAEKGDTLLDLSKTFGIPLGQLVETNGIHEADLIHAGAILLFPSETVQPE